MIGKQATRTTAALAALLLVAMPASALLGLTASGDADAAAEAEHTLDAAGAQAYSQASAAAEATAGAAAQTADARLDATTDAAADAGVELDKDITARAEARARADAQAGIDTGRVCDGLGLEATQEVAAGVTGTVSGLAADVTGSQAVALDAAVPCPAVELDAGAEAEVGADAELGTEGGAEAQADANIFAKVWMKLKALF